MKKKIMSLQDVVIGEVYDRDDLYACSDWVAEENNVQFFSILQGFCVRTEKDNILKDKLVVKEIFSEVE